jgi:hypothetical protein
MDDAVLSASAAVAITSRVARAPHQPTAARAGAVTSATAAPVAAAITMAGRLSLCQVEQVSSLGVIAPPGHFAGSLGLVRPSHVRPDGLFDWSSGRSRQAGS